MNLFNPRYDLIGFGMAIIAIGTQYLPVNYQLWTMILGLLTFFPLMLVQLKSFPSVFGKALSLFRFLLFCVIGFYSISHNIGVHVPFMTVLALLIPFALIVAFLAMKHFSKLNANNH
jgi:hypothetical protein